TGKRLAALHLIEPYAAHRTRVTLGADKGFDAADLVMECREIGVTLHVAQTLPAPARTSMGAPHAIFATRSVSASGSASRRLPAGPAGTNFMIVSGCPAPGRPSRAVLSESHPCRTVLASHYAALTLSAMLCDMLGDNELVAKMGRSSCFFRSDQVAF